MGGSAKDLEDLLDELVAASNAAESVSVADIQETVGRRSFAPMLAICGLLVLTPVGAIPGVPSAFGVVVILLAGQILIGRRSLWLPVFLTARAVSADRLRGSAEKIRPVAARVDRVLRPRLAVLTQGIAAYGIAAACVLLALTLSPLEFVPTGAALPAAAITAFALALMTGDGLLALLGYGVFAATLWLAAFALPF